MNINDMFGSPSLGPPPRRDDITVEAEFSADRSARLALRYTWDASLPIAAFLMNNPSVAGRDESPFDPTARRAIHFAHQHDCGSAWLVNWCPLIATYPKDLWLMIVAARFTQDLQHANIAAIEHAGRQAHVRVVACGPEGFRRRPEFVRPALVAFLGPEKRKAMCLGVTAEGAPLHPLARGKFAIPNSTKLRRWEPSLTTGAPYGEMVA